MAEQQKTMTMDTWDHTIGDPQCEECWSGWPLPCETEGCPGLVHAEFGDEDADCNYWLLTRCDVCGEPA